MENAVGDRPGLADAVGDPDPPVGAASDVEPRGERGVDSTQAFEVTDGVLRHRPGPTYEGLVVGWGRERVHGRERLPRRREDVFVGAIELVLEARSPDERPEHRAGTERMLRPLLRDGGPRGDREHPSAPNEP